MKKINYNKLTEIIVKSQEELDNIPLDFKGRIYIEFGTYWDKAIVKNKYYYSVVARGNSSVEARGNSSIEAWGNSSIVARENSSIVALENSSIEALENSSIVARGNSSIVALENSSIEAWGNSSIVARGNSSIVALENSSIVARENSSIVALENSSIEAGGNSQVLDKQCNGKINISGNARIVYMPKNINDFINYYGIKHTKTKAIFYKAVRKHKDNTYHANYKKDFTYKIGETKIEICNTNIEEECSYGINISHLNWALDFGHKWKDLAILEVETKISDIVMPINTDGKVRTSKVKVLREVPLEECGVYGKILAKRRQAND